MGLLSLQMNLNGCGNAFLAGVDFKRLKRLQLLDLKGNGITSAGMDVLIEHGFESMNLDHLEVLDLSDNQISDDPMMRLFQATENREKVQEIKVDDNPCHDFVLEAVKEKMLNCGAREYLATMQAELEFEESMKPMVGKALRPGSPG